MNVSIPELVDLGAYFGLSIMALGTLVCVVLGGYFAFLLIRRGLSWVRDYATGAVTVGDSDWEKEYDSLVKSYLSTHPDASTSEACAYADKMTGAE